MVVPTSLKLNKFVDVMIPEPSLVYARGRGSFSIPTSGYSGDESVSIFEGRKTDIELELERELDIEGVAPLY